MYYMIEFFKYRIPTLFNYNLYYNQTLLLSTILKSTSSNSQYILLVPISTYPTLHYIVNNFFGSKKLNITKVD